MSKSDQAGLRRLLEGFTQAVNAGDVAAVLKYYDPDCVLSAEPGQALAGERLADAVAELTRSGAHLQTEFSEAIVSGSVALIRNRFRIQHRGGAMEQGHATDVATRRADGTWCYRVSCPRNPNQVNSQ